MKSKREKSLRSLPDQVLIEGYLNGESSQFNELYERYKKQTYSYLNRMLPRQTALVDDLFQQTWIKVIHTLPKYRCRQRFLAWVLRIAHNAAIDHFRKEGKRKDAVSMEEHENWLQVSDAGDEPWRKMDREALSKALHWAVAQLASDQREVFLLRQDAVSFKEIADIQKTSVNTALGRMQYALRNLRKLLAEWDEKGQP